eukprot:scaffold19302_cov146-Isochrysis_galbana.AAC.1
MKGGELTALDGPWTGADRLNRLGLGCAEQGLAGSHMVNKAWVGFFFGTFCPGRASVAEADILSFGIFRPAAAMRSACQ